MQKTKHFEVLPYDLDWPIMQKKAMDELKEILGKHCMKLHAMGSTSVPGLCAKPDLDILCIVDELSASLKIQENGFTFKGEINVPLRYFFSRNKGSQRINLHIVEPGHGFTDLNLSFRNYLRENDAAREAYARLKMALIKDPNAYLLKKGGRFTGYTLSKNDFIKKTLNEANYKGTTVNFCMHDAEWKAYQHLLDEKAAEACEGIYPFIFYKGTKIVAAAKVQKDEVDIKIIKIKGEDAEALGSLKTWINRWAKIKGPPKQG